jgi:hypothetical protein
VGMDGLHRVEVLQVPGQVVLGGEGRRSQLVVILLVLVLVLVLLGAGRRRSSNGGVGAVVVGVVVVVVVVVGARIRRWTRIAVAVAGTVATAMVMMVWCRHGVPRARQHSGHWAGPCFSLVGGGRPGPGPRTGQTREPAGLPAAQDKEKR